MSVRTCSNSSYLKEMFLGSVEGQHRKSSAQDLIGSKRSRDVSRHAGVGAAAPPQSEPTAGLV